MLYIIVLNVRQISITTNVFELTIDNFSWRKLKEKKSERLKSIDVSVIYIFYLRFTRVYVCWTTGQGENRARLTRTHNLFQKHDSK